MSAWLPLSMNDALALAPALMLAAPESVTCSVPLETLSAVVASSYTATPLPASGSAAATPAIAAAMSSSTVCAAGSAFTGARSAASADS